MSPAHTPLEGLVEPGGCERHPTAGRIGTYCLSCVIIPAPSSVEVGAGPGWYEVINPRNATTSIAYVHENGTLYLPEGDEALTPEEFAFAAAQGKAHRLIRADDVTGVRLRAERAEAAIARVRLIRKAPPRSPYNTYTNAQDDGWDQALAAVHKALGAPERCEPKSAGPDHPVNDLWAALVSEGALTGEAAVDLIRAYYDAIHADYCPNDHTPVRPGYAAAANRSALDEIRQAPAELVHTDPEPQVSASLEVDDRPACTCTYGQRCPNCRD
ncbi:hypothetical protein [Streptomyces chartreusis]|uniref:hypothetical protein n=1 Tax=Streptomyces chartreusis TaxID=1969 RepID=UPI00381327C9